MGSILLLITIAISPLHPILCERIGTEQDPHCTTKGCIKIQNFLVPPATQIQLNKTTTQGVIISLGVTKVPVYYIHLQVKSRYCDYFPLTNNSECEEWKTEDIDIADPVEREKTVSSGSCLAGSLCKKGGDCYGDKAQECKTKIRSRWISTSDPKGLDDEEPWENIFHKTCEMHWKCLVRKEESVVHAWGDHETRGYLVNSLIEGSKRNLAIYPNVDTWHSGYGFTIKIPKFHEITQKIPLDCLFSDIKKLCITLEELPEIAKGSVLNLDQSCMAHYDSALIHVPCPHSSGSTGQAQLIDKFLKNGADAASLEDVMKTVVMVLFDNMQSLHNDVVVSSQIHELREMMVKVVISLSKSDPHFLGNLLGAPSITSWPDLDSPVLCPCDGTIQQGAKGCQHGREMINGVWTTRDNNEGCTHPPVVYSSMQNISLFTNQEALSLDEEAAPVLFGAEGLRAIKENEFNYRKEREPVTSSTPFKIENPVVVYLKTIFSFFVEYSWIPAYLSFLILLKKPSQLLVFPAPSGR